MKRITNESRRSGAFYKIESTAAGSVVDHLKEQLIEEWRHFDHGNIDRSQSVAEVTAKVYL